MRWSLNRVLKATVRGSRDTRVSLISGLAGTKQSRRRPGRPTPFSSVPGTPRQGRMSRSYARAGYLKTLVRRRARILRSGAARPLAGLPIALVRGPADGDVTAFVVLVRAPAAAGSAVWMCRSLRFSSGSRPPSRTRRARGRRRRRPCPLACRARSRGAPSGSANDAARAKRSGRPWDLGRRGGRRAHR